MKQTNVKYSVYFLILFYTVGITGFIVPSTHSFFKTLTPFALLLSAGFLIIFHQPKINLKTTYVFSTIFIVSFLAEMIGVKTGLIFGNYIYGSSLGPKILETPLMIGLNWLMLIYCTKVIADRITGSETFRIFIGPALMVGYDLILEQAAPHLGMWSWAGNSIPLKNYIAWFLLALLFHLLVRKSKTTFDNPLAVPVFVIQFLFFVTLVIFFMIG